MLDFAKKLWINLLILLTIKKNQIILPKEVKNSNSNVGIIPTIEGNGVITDGIHKEVKWFARANNLVMEFSGEEPVVYSSDMTTIVKQEQYGYVGSDMVREPEELLADDVDLLPAAYTTRTEKPKSIEFLDAKQQFDARWERIKAAARAEKQEDVEFDGAEIDGVIKE